MKTLLEAELFPGRDQASPLISVHRKEHIGYDGAVANSFWRALNLVLLEPEIPGNTGAIGRLCVGLQATLTLIEPLGFSLADKHLKRAGLDYWPDLSYQVLPSFEALLAELTSANRIFPFTTRRGEPYCNRRFAAGDVLLFGRETRGLPAELLDRFSATCCTIPLFGPIRSLNLAMAAGIAAYEAMRQIRGGFSW